MDPEIFSFALLGSLADIRTALWVLNSVMGAMVGAIVAHALLTRRRS